MSIRENLLRDYRLVRAGDSGPTVPENSVLDKPTKVVELIWTPNEGYDPLTCTHPSLNRRGGDVDDGPVYRHVVWCGLCGKEMKN